jgi:hypothetical protein
MASKWIGKKVTFRHEGAGHLIYGVVIASQGEPGDEYLTIRTDTRVYEDVSEALDEVELA